MGSLDPSSTAFIEGWVADVEVFGVKVILRDAEGIGKALIMHDLALAEEFDHVVDVGVVRQTQDIVIGRARLLLCYYLVFATKLCLVKVRKFLISQGVAALFDSVCYTREACGECLAQKFQ